MDATERIHAELQRTNVLLEELHLPLITLAAQALTAFNDDLPQIEAEAARLINTINQQTAALQALQKQ